MPTVHPARTKPESCRGCACEHHGTDFSRVHGTGSLRVGLIGEASGEMEARELEPFVSYAPAGSVLERIIRRMGLSRDQFFITNTMRCRPKNNWLEGASWEFSALNYCRPNLEKAIADYQPKCLVALGGLAMRELTGMAGEAQGITHLAGYVLPSNTKTPEPIPVLGNFHPAYLRRGNASHQGVFSRILQRAINIAKGLDRSWLWNVDPEDPTTHGPLRYSLHPGLDEAEAFAKRVAESGGLVVSYDIETAESRSLDEDARTGFADTQILLIQFSVEGGTGIAFPWEGSYREIARSILGSSNTKCGHNIWQFDNRVLRANGIEVKGPAHDTLQLFHHWQPDLPAHLQFAASFVQFPFPWKHLAAMDLEFYGICDVDATLRLYSMLERTLRRDDLWGDETIGYLGQVYALRPVLDRMEKRGVPIDDAARVALGKEFDAAQDQLLREIQAMAPGECSRVHPKDGYKGIPPEVKSYLGGGVFATPEAVPSLRFRDKDADGEYYRYEQREFPVPAEDAATGEPAIKTVARWCRVYDFNPGSRNQVISYMKVKGHAIPKTREEDEEGNRKDTTSEKPLRRLASATGDIFYLRVVEYRGFAKLRGTYIEGSRPGPDGHVHPSFGFDSAIGQLTAKNPNSQNYPKLKPTPQLALAIRTMVKAKPGKVITSWDYKSFHVLTLGFLAEDPVWIRLARLDMHSFFAGHVLKLWDGPSILKESDTELMARFKWLKSNPEWKVKRDGQYKRCALGVGNGLSAKGMYERYMEDFPPERCNACEGSGSVPGIKKAAKKCPECRGTGFVSGFKVAESCHLALEQLAPRIFAYQRQERKNAHHAGDRGYRTPFGFSRKFYEVYQFSKGWNPARDEEPPRGDQAEEAVSYRHTNIAHCHLREVMKDLERRGLNEKYGLFNQIHDSLMFHFDESLLEEHKREIPPVMRAKSRILRNATMPDGFWVDVEGEWGYDWGNMHEIEIERTASLAAGATSTAVR